MPTGAEAIRSTPDPAPWGPFPRQLATVVLLVGILALLGFLSLAGQTLLLGFLIAFLLYRPIRWAGGRVRYTVAVAISHILVLAGLAWVALVGLRWVADSVVALQQTISQAPASEIVASILSSARASGTLSEVIRVMGRIFQSIAGLAGVAFIAVIFSFWLLNDLGRARGAMREWFSGQEARQVAQMLARLDQVWIGYLTAQVIFGIVMTIASLVEYGLLGVPYFVLMSVLTGLLTLIPSIGGLIASLVVAVPCLVLGSTRLTMDPVAFTLLVTVINIVITQVSYNFIAVPIVGRFVRLPAALVLISVLVGVTTGSFLFAFLVVPLLSSLRILASFLLNKASGREPYPDLQLTAEAQVGLFGQLMLAPATAAPVAEPPDTSPPDSGGA